MADDVKKFTIGSDCERIKKADIIQPGDWLLKWEPNAPDDKSGFALFTPTGFDPESERGNPLGGLILAAVYFLLEHGDNSFPRELIARANELSKELDEQNKAEGSMTSSSERTLN